MGRPSKFSSEFIDKARDILSDPGRGRDDLAAQLGVSRQTLHNWCRSNPEFWDAVQTGLTASRSKLYEQARQHLVSDRYATYNTHLFAKLVQLVYGEDDSAAVLIPGWQEAKDVLTKFDLLINNMGNGEITPDQANKIADILSKKIQCVEFMELRERVAKLEAANAGRELL